MKNRRLAKLVELIEAGEIGSQAQAVKLLNKAGFDATQGTVSRDLDELGAVRVKTEAGSRYEIVEASSVYGMSLSQVMRNFIVSSAVSGNIIVLKTPPGHAGVVAAALDREPVKGVLGSIAGDDTVFICVSESKKTDKLLKELVPVSYTHLTLPTKRIV